MIGITIGYFIGQNIKTNTSFTTYICVIGIITLFSFDKIYRSIMILLIISYIISFPFMWSINFKWYDILIELYFIIVVYYSLFSDVKYQPIFVDVNDVLRFPVKTEKVENNFVIDTNKM